MSTIIALFQIIPLAISALCILAISGLLAGYLLLRLSGRTARIYFSALLVSAAAVPLAIYHGSNYWLAIHRNPHPMALNPIPLNHESLEILYFLWWCVTSILLWAALFWRKRLAA